MFVQSKIDGAESVNITVEAIDARIEKSNVGRKGDEYAILGKIIAQQNLIKTIEEAIVAELKNRGFTLDGGKVVVVSELIKFFNEFKAEGSVAEVIMNVQVKNLEGNILYSKVISEESINEEGILRSGSKAKKALEGAFVMAVQKLIRDADFINALFEAQTRTQESDIKQQPQTHTKAVRKNVKQKTQKPNQTPEAQKLASLPKDVSIVRISLRSEPKAIRNKIEIRKILAKFNFFEISMNTQGSFANDLFDNRDGTVTDRATGLMWQKGGSLKSLDNSGAKRYLKQLKKQGFAGYSDWRIPTVEEMASLLARSRINGVHLASEFDSKQKTCWTVDKGDLKNYSIYVWIVDFKQGQIKQASFKKPTDMANWPISADMNAMNYIKAVRSVR